MGENKQLIEKWSVKKKLNIIALLLCLGVGLTFVGFIGGHYVAETKNKNLVEKIEVEKIVYKEKVILPTSNYSIILDDEMKELSKYIQKRKSNQAVEICDLIAYHVINESHKHNIPSEVVVGIIEIESMWNVTAKSKANARGLMQILIEDGVDIDPKLAYGIQYNINKGIQILKSKLNKSKGNITLALEYYVGGDKTYHEQVYKFLGKYMLYKMNTDTPDLRKLDETDQRTENSTE